MNRSVSRPLRAASSLACCIVMALAVTACRTPAGRAATTDSDDTTDSDRTARTTPPSPLSGPLTVFAAASLTDAFTTLGTRFEQRHPDVDVSFNFAGSTTLSTQIVQGAPADVFAAANHTQIDTVDDAGLLAGAPTDFATNRLEIAVEPGNPLDIGDLGDLTRSDITLVLAADEVPAGQYAREALDARGIRVDPASLEPDVRAVLSRVALGEADAGIVYASDIVAAGDTVGGVTVPAGDNVVARYPIAALTDAPNPEAAAAFVEYVRSDDARPVLADAGFAAP